MTHDQLIAPADRVRHSTTQLNRKLGLKAGYRIAVVNPPDRYWDLVAPLPDGVAVAGARAKQLHFIHVFVERRAELARALPKLLTRLRQDGMLWVSWPKKSAGVATDVTEDVIRELAFPLGLVDVKVCAVDEVWSGLKLVIRVEQRTS